MFQMDDIESVMKCKNDRDEGVNPRGRRTHTVVNIMSYSVLPQTQPSILS